MCVRDWQSYLMEVLLAATLSVFLTSNLASGCTCKWELFKCVFLTDDLASGQSRRWELCVCVCVCSRPVILP